MSVAKNVLEWERATRGHNLPSFSAVHVGMQSLVERHGARDDNPVLLHHPCKDTNTKSADGAFYLVVSMPGFLEIMSRNKGGPVFHDDKENATREKTAVTVAAVAQACEGDVEFRRPMRSQHSSRVFAVGITNTSTKQHYTDFMSAVRLNLQCNDTTCAHTRTLVRLPNGGFYLIRQECQDRAANPAGGVALVGAWVAECTDLAVGCFQSVCQRRRDAERAAGPASAPQPQPQPQPQHAAGSVFIEAEYDDPPCTGLETQEPDGTWQGVTAYTHATRGNVVLWYGGDTYEGLGGSYCWGNGGAEPVPYNDGLGPAPRLLDSDGDVVPARWAQSSGGALVPPAPPPLPEGALASDDDSCDSEAASCGACGSQLSGHSDERESMEAELHGKHIASMSTKQLHACADEYGIDVAELRWQNFDGSVGSAQWRTAVASAVSHETHCRESGATATTTNGNSTTTTTTTTAGAAASAGAPVCAARVPTPLFRELKFNAACGAHDLRAHLDTAAKKLKAQADPEIMDLVNRGFRFVMHPTQDDSTACCHLWQEIVLPLLGPHQDEYDDYLWHTRMQRDIGFWRRETHLVRERVDFYREHLGLSCRLPPNNQSIVEAMFRWLLLADNGGKKYSTVYSLVEAVVGSAMTRPGCPPLANCMRMRLAKHNSDQGRPKAKCRRVDKIEVLLCCALLLLGVDSDDVPLAVRVAPQDGTLLQMQHGRVFAKWITSRGHEARTGWPRCG